MSRIADALGLSPARHAWGALFCCLPLFAQAAPLTRAEIEATCTGAEDAAHCGRLIEAMQLPRLPGLARRDGNGLIVSLFPSGSTTFTDSDDPVRGRSYSLWDYFDGINSVVLYVTAGDNSNFALLQRATGRLVDLPAEPRLGPTGSVSPWPMFARSIAATRSRSADDARRLSQGAALDSRRGMVGCRGDMA